MATFRFPTPIGTCTIEWTERGLGAFKLPDPPPSDSPPPPSSLSDSVSVNALCHAVAERVGRHLRGAFQDFADLPYDWAKVTPFQAKVLRAVLALPAGSTATYGELARVIGALPGASRAIGRAVGANPWPLVVPCHRVLGAGGKLTGYSGPGGIRTKARLLALEGIELAGG